MRNALDLSQTGIARAHRPRHLCELRWETASFLALSSETPPRTEPIVDGGQSTIRRLGRRYCQLDIRCAGGLLSNEVVHLSSGMYSMVLTGSLEQAVRTHVGGSGHFGILIPVHGHQGIQINIGQGNAVELRPHSAFLAPSRQRDVESETLLSPTRCYKVVAIFFDLASLAAEFDVEESHLAQRLRLSEDATAPVILPISRRITHMADALFAADTDDPLRGVRLRAAMLEILAGSLGALMDGTKATETSGLNQREARSIARAHGLLAARFDRPPTIAALARTVALSETSLMRGFRAAYGETIAQFCLRLRMSWARELLTGGSKSISEVAYTVGYEHPSSFTAAFRGYYGVAPRDIDRLVEDAQVK